MIGIDNRIVGNNLTRNQGAGIYVEGSFNTIDENSALENGSVGITVGAGTKNSVVRNSAVGNGGGVNYNVVAGNNPGSVITANATHDWSNTQ